MPHVQEWLDQGVRDLGLQVHRGRLKAFVCDSEMLSLP
jgi:hypothetical protein